MNKLLAAVFLITILGSCGENKSGAPSSEAKKAVESYISDTNFKENNALEIEKLDIIKEYPVSMSEAFIDWHTKHLNELQKHYDSIGAEMPNDLQSEINSLRKKVPTEGKDYHKVVYSIKAKGQKNNIIGTDSLYFRKDWTVFKAN